MVSPHGSEETRVGRPSVGGGRKHGLASKSAPSLLQWNHPRFIFLKLKVKFYLKTNLH